MVKGKSQMVDCIVQARMTSTRLPGKVLMPIEGKPVLSYLFHQIKFIKQLNNVVLATTINKEDDPVVKFAEENGIKYFRGSEHDVLGRYYLAASALNARHVMRITADCPLIDPVICSQIISHYLNGNVDIVHTGQSFAEGLDCEVFSFDSLEKAHKSAKKISEREHVTLFIYQHPELFEKLTVENETDYSDLRFTIDEKQDFQVVEAIIKGIENKDGQPIKFEAVKQFLLNHPEIVQLNSSIIRNEGLLKSLEAEKNTRFVEGEFRLGSSNSA